jgi:hypothetical protein
MIEVGRVNEIWWALENGKAVVMRLGDARIKTSAIVDVVVARALQLLPGFSREEVLEAWLYQALEQVVEAHGVEPLPPVPS